MKGKLKKIDNKWYVIRGDFKLPLHSNFITMTDYVWVRGIKVYDGDEVEFTEVFVNPMGREVNPNDLGQNHSKCIWYASPSLEDKEDLGYTTKTGIKVSDEMVRATMIPKEYFGKEEQKLSVRLENSLTNFNLTIEEVLKIDNYELKKVGFGNRSIIEIGELKLKNKQKKHLIDMMEFDEKSGLYDEEIEPYENYLKRLKDRRTEDNYKYSDEDFEKYDEYIKDCWKGNMSVYKCLEFMYFAEKEIKVEDVFNDEKKERANRVIQQHKVLKDLSLVNPAHLIMTSDGYGEFPDGYKLTEKGIQYIIEQLNKE